MKARISRTNRVWSDTHGVSSIEFAFLAPILIGGVLMMVDVGMAVAERMEMDRNVRAGAQAAMSLNNDSDAIRTIVLASAGSPDDLTVDVATGCFCASVAAACTALCASGEEPEVFVDISASQPFDGIVARHLLPELTLNSGTRVRLR